MPSEINKKVSVSEEAIKDFDRSFSQRLKELREERGLKRGWVAKRLGVHYNTLKNWELGNAHPGTREILALCQVYHCEPGEFFRDL